MLYKNHTLEQCLYTLEHSEFKNRHGVALTDCPEYLRLVEFAKDANPFIATTCHSRNEYEQLYQGKDSSELDGVSGPKVLGRFRGNPDDIRRYLQSQKVCIIFLNREEDAKDIIHVTPEIAQKETDRLRRIQELKNELSQLEKSVFHV